MTHTILTATGTHAGFIMDTIRARFPYFACRRPDKCGQYFATREEAVNYVRGSNVVKERITTLSATTSTQ